jgi:hypothetical protein
MLLFVPLCRHVSNFRKNELTLLIGEAAHHSTDVQNERIYPSIPKIRAMTGMAKV